MVKLTGNLSILPTHIFNFRYKKYNNIQKVLINKFISKFLSFQERATH